MKENNNFITKIISEKNTAVSDLIKLISTTNDHQYRLELIFFLVENFKDSRILPALIELIKRNDLERASIIFACSLYSPENCKDFIELFIDIIIHANYDESMAAVHLILDFPEPYLFEQDLLDKLAQKLEKALLDPNNNGNRKFIESALEKIGSDDDVSYT